MKKRFLQQTIATFITSLVILTAIAGCSEELSEDIVTISKVGSGSGIKIENESDAAIGYMAVEAGTATVIAWAPSCQDGNQIGGKSSHVIDTADILGWKPGCSVVTCYWECPESDNVQIFSKSVQF